MRLARALRHRNYRLFFGGQSISLVGTWTTRVATSWLVYRLTGSPLLLGLTDFAGLIPTLVLTPFAGVIVDRMDRRRILVITQVLSLVQSVVLAALTFSGRITVLQILLLQFAQGVINAFDTPARQTLVVEMVEDRDDVPNAIALNSTMVNGSRVVGPAMGGLIIVAVGEAWCFTLDAISYIGVIASLLAMRLTARASTPPGVPMLDDLRSGWRYVVDSIPIRSALLLLAIVSFAGMPYKVLMPAMAAERLDGGAGTLGLLIGANGIGALAGGLYLASRQTIAGLEQVIYIGSVTFGLALVGFSVVTNVWLAGLLLALIGGGFIAQAASANTIIQTIVDERFRGRVMAFYTMAFFGTTPIGSLLGGFLADQIGIPITIGAGGIACLIAGTWFASKLPVLRALTPPIPVERSIVAGPDSDTGTATP